MNGLRLFLLLLIAAFSVQSLAAQTVAPPPKNSEATTEPTKEVVIDPKAGDSDIATRLQNILEASGWFSGALVSTREGIVFLDGKTQNDDRREWAANVARKTQDVVAVVNRIEVEPQIEWDFTPAWRETRSIAIQAQQLFPLLVLAAIVLVVSWFLSRGVASLARWGLKKRIRSPLLLQVTTRAIAIPVFLLGLYLVLQVSGLTRLALTLLGGTGVIGIVLGFAFRDIAENFLASLLLSIRNPFNAGDVIEVNGHHGIVQNLNTRSTVLLTLDGNHIQIPNATVFKSVIQNFTSSDSSRNSFVVGIGYDDPVSDAQRVIVETLGRHPAVRNEPEPMALVDELAASTINLRIYFWFDNRQHSGLKLTSALMRQIKLALSQAGISMPDESREVIFPQGVPLIRAADVADPGTHTFPDQNIASSQSGRELSAETDEQDTTVGEGGPQTDEETVQSLAGNSASPDARENFLGSADGNTRQRAE